MKDFEPPRDDGASGLTIARGRRHLRLVPSPCPLSGDEYAHESPTQRINYDDTPDDPPRPIFDLRVVR
jgi:hypothetical protein